MYPGAAVSLLTLRLGIFWPKFVGTEGRAYVRGISRIYEGGAGGRWLPRHPTLPGQRGWYRNAKVLQMQIQRKA